MRSLITLIFSLVFISSVYASDSNESPDLSKEKDYITTSSDVILMSINDGEVAQYDPSNNKWGPFTNKAVQDSVTLIGLSKDKPPVTTTVYGTISSTIYGPPHAAIVGHFGIATNHNWRMAENTPAEVIGKNEISVIDLDTQDLEVTSRIELESEPWLVLPHPDGERIVLAMNKQWLVYRVDQTGKLMELKCSASSGPIYAFDISRDGKTIIAVIETDPESWDLYQFELVDDNQISLVKQFTSEKFKIDQPFAPKISPDGKRALVLNGGGMSDGILDDVLVLDLVSGSISERVPQVADGLESLAIHPSGKFAVISCLNIYGHQITSHLAVIDLESDPIKLLYHIPIERFPEGIEFTADGKMLFVGTTFANHIVVYEVIGKKLSRIPYVLSTGYGPSALAISCK